MKNRNKNSNKVIKQFTQALQYHQAGDLQLAEKYYRQILQTNPNHADTLHWLGMLAFQVGKYEIAINYINQAIAINSTVSLYHWRLGNALKASGRITECIQELQTAIRLSPKESDVYNDLGICFYENGQFSEAIQCFQQAIQLSPIDAKIHNNLGIVLLELEEFSQAIKHFQTAIKLNPNLVGAYLGLADALKNIESYEQAITVCKKALELKSNLVQIYTKLVILYFNLHSYEIAKSYVDKIRCIEPNNSFAYLFDGDILKEQQRIEESIIQYQKAIALKPDYAEAYNHLAIAVEDLGKIDEAIKWYQHSLQIKPTHGVYCNLATLYRKQGKVKEAVENHDAALRIKPKNAETHFNKFLSLVPFGYFKEGWHEYLWRPVRPTLKERFSLTDHVETLAKQLNGERILLYWEQGLGDEIFFLRFAPELKKRGAWLAYQSSDKIKTILERLNWLDQVLGKLDTQLPAVDHRLLIGDLPLVLGMSDIKEIPPPYSLSILPHCLETMRRQLMELGNPPYIGLTWRAGTPKEGKKNSKTLYKDIPLEKLSSALNSVNATFLILQRNPLQEELIQLSELLKKPAHDFSQLNDDLEMMLALLSLLDDYIGVSNTNMHLLAGLGKTAKVLIPYPAEWRWMASGKESPWFIGFKIYRQHSDGSWNHALSELTSDCTSEHNKEIK